MPEVTDTGPPGPGDSKGPACEADPQNLQCCSSKIASASGFATVKGNSEPFSDPQIAAYLAYLTGELIFSDDPIELRSFLFARYAYEKFQRLGTPACRRFAWHTIQHACSLSAKSRHSETRGSSSNALLGQRGKQIILEGRP
jgi:hypothetical protein